MEVSLCSPINVTTLLPKFMNRATRHKYDKAYFIKYKGNEAQALFNAEVDEALAQAESDIADIYIGPV